MSPHTTTLERAFRTVHHRLKPRTPIPRIVARFFPSVAANHSALLENGTLRLRISDLFDDAPAEVLEALAIILLSRLYRKKVDRLYRVRYREYTLTPRMLERRRRTRRVRGRRRVKDAPRGHTYDLADIFAELNSEYFDDTLTRPTLCWSKRRARTVLGRYRFEDDAIVISRYLDSPEVPGYVVRFILFHEMLHLKHGSRIEGTRERVHTPEFRREEKTFGYYRAANEWLDLR